MGTVKRFDVDKSGVTSSSDESSDGSDSGYSVRGNSGGDGEVGSVAVVWDGRPDLPRLRASYIISKGVGVEGRRDSLKSLEVCTVLMCGKYDICITWERS